MPTFETVHYETPAPNVARVVKNRPDTRNAQNLQMSYDLDVAFSHALADDAVHQLCHAHNQQQFGVIADPSGLPAAVKR